MVNGLVPSVQVTSVGGPSETLKLRVKTGGLASLVEMRENIIAGSASGPSIVVTYMHHHFINSITYHWNYM